MIGLRGLMVAGAVLAATWIAAVPAQASHVQCGDVITLDTVLDSDLIDCPGTGLTVQGANVTLDLDGHLVATTGGWAIRVDSSRGAIVEDGRTSTAGETCDVVFEGSSDSLARRLTGDGVCVQRSERTEVEHSTLGIASILQSADSIVRKVDAGTVHVLESSRVHVHHVHVALSRGCGLFAQFVGDSVFEHVDGVSLCLVSGDGNVFRRLRFTRGCNIFGGERNLVEDTRCTSVGLLDTDENAVIDNKLSGGSTGIIVSESDRNLIAGNKVTRASGSGIELFLSSDDNRVERNRAVGNGTWGIFVNDLSTDAERNVLIDNTANRNGKDGIEVRVASTTLTQNIANRNAELGISAVPGVIDGGGNKARGNGDPAECVNVECRPRRPGRP